MRDGTMSRLMAADGPYYDFYSVSPECFGYTLVLLYIYIYIVHGAPFLRNRVRISFISFIQWAFFNLYGLVYNPYFTSRYTTGYLQRLVQTCNVLHLWFRHYVITKLFQSLDELNLLLKCVEDTSEETCNADGVYVMLQNQMWGNSLNFCGSFTWEQTAFRQEVAGRLYTLFRAFTNWWGRLVHFVEVWTETDVIC
jgi:hypothetical protein